MTQFTQHGYDKVRDYIKNTFKHISIVNDATEVTRVLTNDITVVGNEIQYKVVLENTGGTFTGNTINGANLHETMSDATPIATVTFSNFTFEAVQDTITITIKVQVPMN